MNLDDSQKAAVELMLSAAIGVVTGGPGTGKTTTTRAALDALEERGLDCALAAPTGKAARRMMEATGRPASTIHRLLEYNPIDRGYGKRDGFFVNADNPLEADVVIVDEASMVDIELASSLLEAVQAPTRLILVGDAAQLPSVGPGRFFAELIESAAVPVARLTTLHRAAAESWVCSQAPEVLAGRVPDLRERDDFRWIEHSIRDHAVDALVELGAGVHEALADVEPGESQVLVPQNVGPAGGAAINRRLQAVLNPKVGEDGWRMGKKGEGSFELRRGDRVIQTKNDYLRDVMNGEVGVVERVGREELVVRFDAEVTYDRPSANALRLAYALTTHKYQGSEVPWAVVLCHSTHTRMLTRTWLYTSITRAKQGVVLVGDRVGLERAVKSTRDTKRNTGLAERLKDALEEERAMGLTKEAVNDDAA